MKNIQKQIAIGFIIITATAAHVQAVPPRTASKIYGIASSIAATATIAYTNHMHKKQATTHTQQGNQPNKQSFRDKMKAMTKKSIF